MKYKSFDKGAQIEKTRRKLKNLREDSSKSNEEKNKIEFKIKQQAKINREKAMNKYLSILMSHLGISKINGKYNVTIIWGHYKQKGRISEKLKNHWHLKHGIRNLVVDESFTSQKHYEHGEDTLTGEIIGICTPVLLMKKNRTENKSNENPKVDKRRWKWRENSKNNSSLAFDAVQSLQ